jgi:dihydropyrimidinase
MDLVIRGGTVVTAAGVGQAEIGVEGGRIVALGTGLPTGTEEIDAGGAYIFPGGVDVHTHLNPVSTMVRPRADDFYHGMRAAAAGGVTTICDFAYQFEGDSLQLAVDRARDAAAANAVIDYSFHITIQDPTPAAIAEIPAMVDAGFPTFKFFMPRAPFLQRAGEAVTFIRHVGQAGGLAFIHCEDPAIIEDRRAALLADGRTAVRDYPDSRPREVEVSATARAMQICSATGCPVYIVHLSCEPALQETRRARAQGLPVYVETRPIYLYLTEDLFKQGDQEAAKYVGIPPLRDRHDIDVLWEALRSGDIHTVCTDHVGYALAEKYHEGDTWADVPAGMSNLETNLPMLYSEGVGKGRITLERFVELIATNPAKLTGFYPRKGTIAVGADADLCILDPAKKMTVSPAVTHYATDYDIYDGFEVTGWPVYTISRGEVILRDGEPTTAAGRGRLIERGRFRGL